MTRRGRQKGYRSFTISSRRNLTKEEEGTRVHREVGEFMVKLDCYIRWRLGRRMDRPCKIKQSVEISLFPHFLS